LRITSASSEPAACSSSENATANPPAYSSTVGLTAADLAKAKLDSLLHCIENIDTHLETEDVQEEDLEGAFEDYLDERLEGEIDDLLEGENRRKIGVGDGVEDDSDEEICQNRNEDDLTDLTSFHSPETFSTIERRREGIMADAEQPVYRRGQAKKEKLLTRLEQVDVQLDALDDKRVECYGGEKAQKPVRKLPDQTVVYDVTRGIATIETLAEFYRKNASLFPEMTEVQFFLEVAGSSSPTGRPKVPSCTTVYDPKTQSAKLILWRRFVEECRPKVPTYTTVYDPKTQTAKLLFWKQYVEEGHQAADLEARKPKPLPRVPEYTSVYDKESQTAKLMKLEDYYKKHKPPKQAYAAVYDAATQGIKLIFWKTYVEEYLAKDLQERRSKKTPVPDYTSVYDPTTQEAKLVTWEAYLRTHKPPPAGHYTTVYDAQTQSCKLVTWRDYLEYYKAKDAPLAPVKPKQEAVVAPPKAAAAAPPKAAAARKAIPEYTAVYDEETRSVKLQLWDEYIKSNRPQWTQSYAAVYDRATQSIKTVFWKQYKENYLMKDLEARKVKTIKLPEQTVEASKAETVSLPEQTVEASKAETVSLPEQTVEASKAKTVRLPEQTIVYDPKTQTAKLQLLSEAEKPSWTQSYAAVYDPTSQSIKLVFWKQYLENYLPKDLEARKPKKLPEQTVIYDPKTKGLKLQLWSDYEKENKPSWTQAYAAVYDPASQSVKLVYWRQYLEYYLAKDLEARKPKSLPEQTIIYDPKTQGLRLQLWSDYEKENKPAWTQAYAAIYDTETKSVKLIYWKDYLENYLPYDIKAREAMEKKMTQKGS